TSPPTRIFESGAILVYLAEKFGAFLPKDPSPRAECLSWLFWQMGSAPYLGGGFGHFYAYAPAKYEYPINRFTMEVKRQLDVLDPNLAERRWLIGDEYTIADMAVFPWYGGVVLHNIYDAEVFLEAKSYTNVVRWAAEIEQRPAVRRGQRVNKVWGPEAERVPERHSPSDFVETKLKSRSARGDGHSEASDGARAACLGDGLRAVSRGYGLRPRPAHERVGSHLRVLRRRNGDAGDLREDLAGCLFR